MSTRTFDQLIDFFGNSARGHECLVGADDPQLGPYAKWISVPVAEIERYRRDGYRQLTRREIERLIGEPEDYTEGWKHSD
jgi:hypothetical protein